MITTTPGTSSKNQVLQKATKNNPVSQQTGTTKDTEKEMETILSNIWTLLMIIIILLSLLVIISLLILSKAE